MAMIHFQCPACGYDDYEVAQLMSETDFFCVVCLEERGRQVHVRCWEEPGSAPAQLPASPEDCNMPSATGV